jgi:hypothetical protein
MLGLMFLNIVTLIKRIVESWNMVPKEGPHGPVCDKRRPNMATDINTFKSKVTNFLYNSN